MRLLHQRWRALVVAVSCPNPKPLKPIPSQARPAGGSELLHRAVFCSMYVHCSSTVHVRSAVSVCTAFA